MNRGRGSNRRDRGGGGGGGKQHYAAKGRSAQPTGQWVARGAVGAGGHLDDASSGSGSSEIVRRNSETASVDDVTKKFDDALLSSEYPSEHSSESHGSLNVPPKDGNFKGEEYQYYSNKQKTTSEGTSGETKFGNFKGVQTTPKTEPVGPCYNNYSNKLSERSISTNSRDRNLKNCSPSHFIPTSPHTVGCQSSPEVQSGKKTTSEGTSGETKFGNFKGVQNLPKTEPVGTCHGNYFPSLPTNSELSEGSMSIKPGDQNLKISSPSHFIPASPQTVGCQSSPGVQSGMKTTSGGNSGVTKFDSSCSQHDGFSFDICEERRSSGVKLKTPLHKINKAKRKEELRMQGDNIKVFRPGMILLKGYISLEDQVKMVKLCRDFGRGPGGFYQPGFRDGAKLHLKMMCLGKNWDPEKSEYGDLRPADQTKPPPIPDEFQLLVKGAIEKCHQYLESDNKVLKARNILPPMTPNICIINFYTKTGKLGLHKDKDESSKSLNDGLPVVSFSLGDKAEFLFGDERDVDKADKIELESGDVLIFGGKSRHIFHGVSNILADTAPGYLMDETLLKPGRLNLTFREY
ncbi:hypothetical protein AAHA92_26857 [Salvia divinorum]|uniref:Fe2OG dioxygenase domain-containing protein n=1 Tax=Salvia divinorum TaxID=28513 RepID=A0ABD1G4I8_SALDI